MKQPDEIAMTVVNLTAKVIISIIVSIAVVFTGMYFHIDAWGYLLLGALLMQVVIRAFEKDTRQYIKDIWLYYKHKNQTET